MLCVTYERTAPLNVQITCLRVPANNHLTGKGEALIVLPGLDVIVEKVAVDGCLHNSGYPHNPLAVARLGEVSVHPVQQIQPTVATEQEHVVACQRVHILCALEQHELGQNGHRLQVDGERPQHLCDCEFVVYHKRKEHARKDQEQAPERVLFPTNPAKSQEFGHEEAMVGRVSLSILNTSIPIELNSWI